MNTVNLDSLLSELDRMGNETILKSEDKQYTIGFLCGLNSVRKWAVTHTASCPKGGAKYSRVEGDDYVCLESGV